MEIKISKQQKREKTHKPINNKKFKGRKKGRKREKRRRKNAYSGDPIRRKMRATGRESHSLLKHYIQNRFVDNLNFCTVLNISMFVSTGKVSFPLTGCCKWSKRVVVNGVKSGWAPALSDVPQGTVLGPLLFSLYIINISSDIESEIRLFADDCVCYREIKAEKDTMKLQKDIDRLGSWARKWGMRFQPVKCSMMQLTRKRIKKIYASDTLEGNDLENVESIKYFGVTITSDLRWNTHVSMYALRLTEPLDF